MKDLKEEILDFYKYFCRKTAGKVPYINQNHWVTLDKFATFLEKEYNGAISRNFLWDYFCFQFEYWRTKNGKFAKNNRVDLSWVIGEKAYDRWKSKVPNYQYFYKVGLLTLSDLTKSDLIPLETTIDFVEVLKNEEREKKRFYNQDRGYLWCVQTTTLFKEKSKYCQDCNFKKKCKEVKNELFTV